MTEFAIVGAAVRLPGVADLDEFGSRLLAGHCGLRTLSPEESLRAGVAPSRVASPRYVARASVIDDAECFAGEFFGITPGEAASIDPQHRLLLTLAHEALESSGVDPEAARVGTYVSTTISSNYLNPRAVTDQSTVDYQPLLGNDKDFSGVRIAHKLGLRGPALSVQSACSSSLVAVHQACAALAFGDADAALVGGVSLSVPQSRGYVCHDGGVLSPTGECRPFDADSNGTIKGNGGAVVVIRRLEDALYADDEVLAVLSGTAVNNDGSRRMAFTAPSPAGQQQVLSMALERAGIAADDVQFVETHGTGTQLGDPIEFKALRSVYGRDPSRPCYLGSLKANYGHLDAAAGIVGLLKAVLVTRSGQVFPQPNFATPNPHIPLAETRFVIPTRAEAFPAGGYAAVSSFGMGGTNAHALVRSLRDGERAPAPVPALAAPVVVEVSAQSAGSVLALCIRLAEYLQTQRTLTVVDVATTLRRRRVSGATCRFVVTTIDELVDALKTVTAQDITAEAGAPGPAAGADVPSGRHIWLPPTPLDASPISSAAGDPVVPRSLREDLFGLVAAELGGSVDAETDFFAAGGESIALVEIVGKLTDHHEFVADFTELDGLTTVGAIAGVLQAQAARSAGGADPGADPILTFGPASPVYFHPPAGGTNFCYSALSRMIPGVGFNAFRTRLHEPGDSIETIAARNIDILARTGRLADDLIVGGYSFGGNVGLEMALQLQRAGRVPRRLVLFDSIPPSAYRGTARADEEFDDAIAMVVHQATTKSSVEQRRHEFAGIVEDGGSPTGVLYQDFVRLWRDNQRALVEHKPTAVLECPITLFSTADALLPEETLHLGIEITEPTEWQRYTTRTLEVIPVPGNHYSLFLQDHCLRAVAEALPGVLDTERR